MKAHFSVLGIPALALVLLAGCTPGDPMATPSAVTTSTASPTTTTATATPTPTASPSASPVATTTRPSIEELVLEPSGFALLPLGVDPATIDPAISIVTLVDLECEISGWFDVTYESGDGSNFVVWDDESIVRGIQVFSPSIRTATGIRVGSARTELLAAYPGTTIATSNFRFDVYSVPGEGGQLLFAVARADSGYWDDSEGETVQEMKAVGTDVTPFAPSFHPIGPSCI